MKIIEKFRTSLKSDLGRSILISTMCKPVGMLLSFLYTPLLLAYLGDEAYGIWSTVLSIVNWINYFDVGIGNGLRNHLAKDIANKDYKGAKKLISTSYILLIIISLFFLVVGTIIIQSLDCNVLFHTDLKVKLCLQISFVFICFNFVLALVKSQLYATQQAEKVGIMTILIQFLNLIGIKILSIFSKGNIIYVAVLIGLTGTVVYIFFTGYIWFNNKSFIPNHKFFSRNKVSSIGALGVKFFVIQIAALVLYTTDNMIITNLFGPVYVTPYNTAYVAFGIVNGVFSAFQAPMWSEYTLAKEKGDYKWIKMTLTKLDLLLVPIGIALSIIALLFRPLSRYWLGKTLVYTKGLLLCMAIYYFLLIWGSIYATVMNGMGQVDLQLKLGVSTAILNIPLSVFLGKTCGLHSTGVLLATIICMMITNIPVTIMVHRNIGKHMVAEI